MAKKNDAALSKGATSNAGLTAENTPRHKLLAMGQKVDTGAEGGKKTRA